MHRTVGLFLLLAFWMLSPGAAGAQEASRLTAEEAVRLAVEHSPSVAAARARAETAAAGVRGAQSPYNLQAELAPGVGFTNGNALLSQQFDIGGRRSALARAAVGEREAAEAGLQLARLQAAAEARAAYFDLARARAVQAAAEEAADLARRIRDLVRRRVAIGEAPQVQVIRAEIEVARAEQEVARARGEVRGRAAGLNLLLAREPGAPLSPGEELVLPEEPGPVPELLAEAARRRPEIAVARGLVEAGRGGVEAARALRRPELFTELASDAWSLDREPLRSRNFGLQARLTFPLFDRGRLRAEVEQARARVAEQEAEVAVITRTVRAELERAAAELAASREVVRGYQSAILPRSRELLQATQRGFELGLSTFLEVLEAQRVVRQTQVEYQSALFEAVRARIALDRAVGRVPGMETRSTGRENQSVAISAGRRRE